MNNTFNEVFVIGHTLVYRVVVPLHPRMKSQGRRMFTHTEVGAARIHRLLEIALRETRIKLIGSQKGHRAPFDKAKGRTFRVWDMLWFPQPDANTPDSHPEALRIQTASEILGWGKFDNLTDDLNWKNHWFPENKSATPESAVYVVLDVSQSTVTETKKRKGGSETLADWDKYLKACDNAGLVVVHLMGPAEPITDDRAEKLVSFLSKIPKPNRTTIVITSDRLLRAARIPVSDDRPWEAFADECCREFRSAEASRLAGALANFDHLIIRHQAFAAVHLTKADEAGEWLHYLVNPNRDMTKAPGFLRGFNSLLGASVLAEVVLSKKESITDRVDQGIADGLNRCAAFDANGFLRPDPKNPIHCKAEPFMDRVEELFEPHFQLRHEEDVPDGGEVPVVGFWVPIPSTNSLLRKRAWSAIDVILRAIPPDYTTLRPVAESRNLAIDVGQSIVQYGLDYTAKDRRFPIFKFGKLKIVDRRAFEDVGEIQAAMIDYLDRFRSLDQPLCLALFGAPGGGKSFAVKEIAKSLRHEALDPKQILEVNVAQYTCAEELAWVFRKVRDIALQGKVPLVFFDEFDTGKDGIPFGWQQTFLAPMQDGKFGAEPEQIVYRHGIFVFVGGVNPNFEMFHARARNREFIEAKGPDFVSRLVRHLNVLGITQEEPDDFTFIVRRAVLLRDLLDKYQKGIFHDEIMLGGEVKTACVEPDVSGALLTVAEFRHGMRSLEAIVRTSRLGSDRPRFLWSALPPHSQLDMHVDVAQLKAARADVIHQITAHVTTS